MKSDQLSEGLPCNQAAPTAGYHNRVTSKAPDTGLPKEEAKPRFLFPDVILYYEDDPLPQDRNGLTSREYDFTWSQACTNHPAEARLLLDRMAIMLDEHEALQSKR